MLRTFPCANLQLFEKEVIGMEKHQKRMKDEEFPETAVILKPVASPGVSTTIRSMLSVELAFEPKIVYVRKASVFIWSANGATSSDIKEPLTKAKRQEKEDVKALREKLRLGLKI
ncbi:hypothetical protein HID58_024707 [Brassica napus]|uniref:Uncharacterized protein n=1 Tax=Brassica napus TaxID=3708 RepID=A0ABQ8CJR6_BRANA|nr:hypothetical protein HID58_024707 [Brassica napus]